MLFSRNKRVLDAKEKKEINYYFNLRNRDNAVNVSEISDITKYFHEKMDN